MIPLPVEHSGCCFSIDGSPKLCWMIHTGCNLRCRHCAVFDNRFIDGYSGLRGKDEIGEILAFIRMRQIRKVVVSGGEPTLSPWLGAVLDALAREEVSFSLSTNATMITPSRAAELKALGLRKTTVSLDGARRETHEWLRGPRSWERAERGIAALVSAGLSVTVGVFLRDDVAAQARSLAEHCRALGVGRLSFFRPIPRGRYLANASELPSNVPDSAIIKATTGARSEGLRVTIHDPQCLSEGCPSGGSIFGAVGGNAFDHCLYKGRRSERFLLDAVL